MDPVAKIVSSAALAGDAMRGAVAKNTKKEEWEIFMAAILDAGPALGLPGRYAGGRMLVLIVVAGDARVGLAIDAVLGLEDAGGIVPFGEGTPGPQLELGLGLVRRNGGVALLLNVTKLLATLRISARWAL